MTIDLSRAYLVAQLFCRVEILADKSREQALDLYSQAQAQYEKLSPLEKQHAMAALKKFKEQNKWPQA